MARLSQNSTPAERALGCSFAETFETSAKVVDNGGTVTSAPVINHGAAFDGTDDVITYPTVGLVKSISFWVTLATTTENIMQLSSTHSIEVSAGTLTATGLSSPTFYIDGVATATITTARSHVTITTATAFDADAIQVGQDASFGEFTIEELRLWTRVVSVSDALNYYNGTTYTYRNRAVLDLPMLTAQHDAGNSRTLDVSGNANHASFGAGAAEPTKLTEQGYNFGGDDYMQLATANALLYTGDETVFFVSSGIDFSSFPSASGYVFSTRDGATGGFSVTISASTQQLGSIIGSTAQSASTTAVGSGLFSGCAIRKSNSSVDYYFNGIADGSDSSLTGTYTNSTNQFIGTRGDGGGGYAFLIAGEILTILRFDFALSPLQVAEP